MNSERIERRFGSYGVEVVAQAPGHRASSLYSIEDGQRVCRTYATVAFCLPVDAELEAEHRRIAAGESIGTAFKSAGWRVRKRHVCIRERILAEDERTVAELMQLQLPCQVAEHRYVFEVARETVTLEYAQITELHHPEYLDLAQLRAIYPGAPWAGGRGGDG